jgi:hypothetical protein
MVMKTVYINDAFVPQPISYHLTKEGASMKLSYLANMLGFTKEEVEDGSLYYSKNAHSMYIDTIEVSP